MSKKEWLQAYIASKSADVRIKHEDTGIAWAGFWIGLGMVIAVGVWKGQIVLK